ncbi:MAG: hypothetical protein U0V54_10100 [Saprospiraceae bacterium]
MFKWDLNRDISFNIEFSTRRLFTDYIDDVSTVYADNATILNRRGDIAAQLADRSLVDGIGVAGRQRGNSRDNDTLLFIGFGVMRYLGILNAPEFPKPTSTFHGTLPSPSSSIRSKVWRAFPSKATLLLLCFEWDRR